MAGITRGTSIGIKVHVAYQRYGKNTSGSSVVIVTAENGVWPSRSVIATGGQSRTNTVNGNQIFVSGNPWISQYYTFLKNGSLVSGYEFSGSSGVIPFEFFNGDTLQIQDAAGNISNSLTIVFPENVWVENTEIWHDGPEVWSEGSIL